MSNDQLERELEDFFARSATDAVPDTRRAPAPPWREQQRRSRVSDVRRFGRATPWLVAAVLLVIAGLGVGAAVGFDASGPDREGPVATDPPSPSASVTAPDGTIGTPVNSTATTPSSHPTLSRTANGTGPDDGVGDIARIGGYGPYTAGMTQAQAEAALGKPFSAFGGHCTDYVDLSTHFSLTARGGIVVGIVAPESAQDASGNGVGTTLAALESSYPAGTLAESSSGWVFSVADGGNGLGFLFSSTTQPGAADTVTYLYAGTADYARGFELCSG